MTACSYFFKGFLMIFADSPGKKTFRIIDDIKNLTMYIYISIKNWKHYLILRLYNVITQITLA